MTSGKMELYCNGDQTYSMENEKDKLSLIDSVLFTADSIDKLRIRVFWKDTEENYRFINGLFILNKKPYQVEEEGKYRWIFPLSIISKYIFRMPEKYSFCLDIRKVRKENVRAANIEDEISLLEFNNTVCFELTKRDIGYKRIPQKKNVCSTVQYKKC